MQCRVGDGETRGKDPLDDLIGFDRTEVSEDHELFRSEDCSAYTVGERALPLDELLSSFSQTSAWVPKTLSLARANGVATASCAVVLVHYLHEPVGPAPGPLTYLGAVQI